MSPSSRVLHGETTDYNLSNLIHEDIRTEETEYRQTGHRRERSSEELAGIGQGELAGIHERPVVVPLRSLQMNRIRTCRGYAMLDSQRTVL